MPFKILAVVVMFLLSFLIMLGRLFSNVSSWAFGLLLLVTVGSAIYCVTQARWQDVAILTVIALMAFLVMVLIELGLFTAERLRDSLGDFFHS
ncbi:MAG: hypothetical protein LUH07_01775 [Lachnospiraceae bacterium]|nr:hypothetical protein [Lachnospiraceae bacterium]